METANKILATAVLGIFILAAAGFFAYSQGETTTTQRLTAAAPYQTESHSIGADYDLKMVSHTEYWTGETGKIAVRLINAAGNPISVDYCNATIKYPDTTDFVSTAAMTVSTITGNHYYDFTVPSPEGVYEYAATCVWNSGARSQTVSSSFHVSPALNTIKLLNTTINTNNLYLINLTQDVADVYNDTQYIRSNMIDENTYAANFTQINNQFNQLQNNITALYNYCGSPETASATICDYISEINNTLANSVDYTDVLSEINATTQNTYTYVTTTLYNRVNDVFNLATEINTTVTNIQATTTNTQNTVNNINNTITTIGAGTTEILTQLNNTVTMTISSG